MESRSRNRRLAVPVVIMLLGAGMLVACHFTPGCFLHAAPHAKRVAQPKTLGEKPMSTAQTQHKIEHVSQSNFEQKVLKSTVPVLVDFYADWCRPCQMLAPVLEEVARETPDAKIVKVNVDQNPELAAQYNVAAIPSLLVFKDGEIAAERTGLARKADLKTLLAR